MPPQGPGGAVRRHRAAILAAVALAGVMIAGETVVWYPTTQQPSIVLSDVSLVKTASCVPFNGYYGNTYDYSFLLVNAGTADGDAAVQQFLGGLSMGFLPFLVPQRSSVPAIGHTVGEFHPTPAGCTADDAIAFSLASVRRHPEIDVRALTYGSITPAATVGFAALVLGVIGVAARRRGIHILQGKGFLGWGFAFLVVWGASCFAAVVTMVLVAPYNYPVDWTPVWVFGSFYLGAGVALSLAAWRLVSHATFAQRPPA